MAKAKTKVSTAPKVQKQLTPQQQSAIFFAKCKTYPDFVNWIKYFIGLHLPDQTVSRFADTNPLHCAWLIYDICVNKNNPKNIEELLIVAGRGSGKTLIMAIVELMVLLHDQRDVAHVGAILSQASRCYQYQQGFLLNDRIKNIVRPDNKKDEDCVLIKSTMEKSVFNINGNKCSIEVLPCTLKSVNGPHVPFVAVDEIDTVSGEGVRAFKDISGMIDSRGNKKALRVGISTRKSRYGLMNQQIEDADEAGRTVLRWTAFEFAEKCPDSRSGIRSTPGYIIQDTMEVISEEIFEQKSDQKKKEYTKVQFPGENCLKCAAAAICLGDSKKQCSASPMLKPITDVIKKVKENGADWALAQLMNLKPSVEGIVFKEFDEKQHVKSWNEMWRILTDKEYPGECTHDIFIKKCHQMQLQCYAGVDFGWSNPSTVVFFFVDNRENIYVVRAEGMTYVNNPTWAQMIQRKWHTMYRCSLYFIDMAQPGDAVTFRQEGLAVGNIEAKDDIGSGIQVIKKWLHSLASPEPKLFFAKDTCGPIITEFSMYHFKTNAAGEVTDEYDTEYDHYIDALRYGIYSLFGKNRAIIDGSTIDDENSVIDNRGQYLKMPNAREFAASQGIQLSDAPIDTSKLGKIGTASELEDDNADDISGSGGFLWSF